MYSALVLAGGESFCVDENGEPTQEALLNIDGRPMLSYVIEALEQSTIISNIFIAGADCLAILSSSERVRFVRSGDSIFETLLLGTAAAGSPEKILLVTTDIPLVTGDVIDKFIRSCEQSEADFYYPVIAKQVMLTMFPASKRTYFRLRDGIFTGGNIFLAKSSILPGCKAAVRKITDNRKKPWRLAAMLGWFNLLKFICGSMSVHDAQIAADNILEIKTCVIDFPYAQIGMDVDKLRDVIAIENYLKKK